MVSRLLHYAKFETENFPRLQDYQFTGPEKDFSTGEVVLLDEQKFDELLTDSYLSTVERGSLLV